MNIIYKNNLRTASTDANKVSQFSPSEIAILDDSIELTTETTVDGDTVITDNYPQKYRKSITLTGKDEVYTQYDLCTSIELMSDSEKVIIDAELAYADKYNSFSGRQIRISGDISEVESNSTLANLLFIATVTDSVKVSTKDTFILDEDNIVTDIQTTVYICVQKLKVSDYNKLKNNSNITIEVLSGSIDDIDESTGKNKYLILEK